uniref:Transposase Tc1-like domain-containing protein n=1 Tax=Octopus bimaculoides TaxID=37653 RepID=A0A0L8FUY2_OCTBM
MMNRKSVIIKESAKGTSLHVIAEKLGRHVDMVRQLLKDSSPKKKWSNCGTSKTVTARDLRHIGRKLHGKLGQTSKTIFTASGLLHVPKTTRNCILRTMTSVRGPLKLLPLTSRHRSLRLQWAQKYISSVLFTDETRVILTKVLQHTR